MQQVPYKLLSSPDLKFTDIASAATVNLDAAVGNYGQITGTNAITAITLSEGKAVWVRFTGALTLTNGANLVLMGAVNRITAAGDWGLFVAIGAVVYLADYIRAGGTLDLPGGQIAFPVVQAPSADAHTLDDYAEGTFTGTLTGCTTSPTGVFRYVKVGGMVTIACNAVNFAGVSNSTFKTITGMPAALKPSANTNCGYWTGQDNGGAMDVSSMTVDTGGVINVFKGAAGGPWTNLGNFTIIPSAFTYPL